MLMQNDEDFEDFARGVHSLEKRHGMTQGVRAWMKGRASEMMDAGGARIRGKACEMGDARGARINMVE